MRQRALLTVVLLGTLASVASSQTTRIAVSVDSRLWIEGASNLSRWSCKAKTLDAAIDVDSGVRDFAELARHLRGVTVSVPITALTCGHAPMDKSLRTALKAEDGSGNIVATLDAVTREDSASHTVHTVGRLKLAGRENEVKVDIDATLGDGGLEAHGELPILLSDYGIVPPRGLFGVIRCNDRVVVKFALTVTPNTGASATTFTSELALSMSEAKTSGKPIEITVGSSLGMAVRRLAGRRI